MIKGLDRLRADWPEKKEAYLSAYRKDCITLGKEVRLLRNGIEKTGAAEDIDNDFGLVVRFSDGRCESITSGEVSVRGLYGYV
jgi:BirA family biotin operon repressor/biotin-[acetyl-CoA-carboxylase] ligase